MAEHGHRPGLAGEPLGEGRVPPDLRATGFSGPRAGRAVFAGPCRPRPSRRGPRTPGFPGRGTRRQLGGRGRYKIRRPAPQRLTIDRRWQMCAFPVPVSTDSRGQSPCGASAASSAPHSAHRLLGVISGVHKPRTLLQQAKTHEVRSKGDSPCLYTLHKQTKRKVTGILQSSRTWRIVGRFPSP